MAPTSVTVGWAFASMLPVMFAVILRNFHMYWADHKRQYEKALIFLNSNACLDSGMKAALAEFNLCDSAQKITDVPPTLAAWYDVVEDLHICGHGRCLQLYSDLTTKIPLIIIISVTATYMLYGCIEQRRRQNGLRHFQLPNNNPLTNE